MFVCVMSTETFLRLNLHSAFADIAFHLFSAQTQLTRTRPNQLPGTLLSLTVEYQNVANILERPCGISNLRS